MSTCEHNFRFLRYDVSHGSGDWGAGVKIPTLGSPLTIHREYGQFTNHREVFYCTKCLHHQYITPDDLQEENPWTAKTIVVLINN